VLQPCVEVIAVKLTFKVGSTIPMDCSFVLSLFCPLAGSFALSVVPSLSGYEVVKLPIRSVVGRWASMLLGRRTNR